MAGVDGAAYEVPRGRARQLPSLLIGLLLFFNILDVILTARALSLGVAEANPVMAGLFGIGGVPFGMMVKFAAVSAGAWMLWRLRHLPVAARGMNIVVFCYGLVVIYHVVFQLGTI